MALRLGVFALKLNGLNTAAVGRELTGFCFVFFVYFVRRP